MLNIKIEQASITDITADCIVNAANEYLLPGGGVCGAVFQEAGYDELKEACERIGYCETGSAVATLGYLLKARYIIHAVGPQYIDGHHGEAEKLYSCYQSALALARQKGCASIVFPLISSGIYGYPKKEAWIVAVKAIRDYFEAHPNTGITVIFSIPDQNVLAMGEAILKGQDDATDSVTQQDEDFVFFWREDEPNGMFSQWYKAPFVAEGITYPTCEHYMMAKKALLFEDMRCYLGIMSADSPEDCKNIGRMVGNFDSIAWAKCSEEVVFNANLAKFSQHPQLKKALLATGSAILAEASPYDQIWGIGFSADDAESKKPEKWTGQNKLGNVLMRVRETLRKTM